ncbi:MAG: hypothetical protein COW85_08435 [Ignavibacteria bacterium CG22_combo_CG10-13_8_21_14_all_37_15]|nr:hypothetical protein [Ignavibacteria bacterium]PIP77514.1 MAG: hypothetical protein COW85_08435 [Ignavibacteria bacterium CG22_combo_CG10-13_8_21_14_all_37_15]
MKYLLLVFSLFALMIIGCNKKESNPVNTTVDDRVSFEINYLQYDDNNYFIDEDYADTSQEFNMFNLYYGSSIPIINPKYFVKNIEVYISVNQISQAYISIPAIAYMNLSSRSGSSMYSDSIRNYNLMMPGEVAIGRFRVLSEGVDYYFNKYTGTLTFLFPINDNDIIAAAYVVDDGSFSNDDDLHYGEFITELVNNSKTKGVLKLIKPQNLIPQYADAWKLKMKNIYQIPSFFGRVSDLDLDIFLKKPDGSETNIFHNLLLLIEFGFDKESEEGRPLPDGIFDRKAGITFNPETGEIIFPLLEPFGHNIPSELIDFKYQAIYDTLKTQLSLPGNSFVIRGKYKPL